MAYNETPTKGTTVKRIPKISYIMFVAAIVVPPLTEYIVNKLEERKLGITADKELNQEILADLYAKRTVLETIHKGGGYSDRLIGPDADFEFHRITYFFEKD